MLFYLCAARRLPLVLLFPAILLAPGRMPATWAQESPTLNDDEQVGYAADGRIVTPVNQVLTPYGRQVDLPGMRPRRWRCLRTDRCIVTAGKTSELVVVDRSSGEIRKRVTLAGRTIATARRSAGVRRTTSIRTRKGSSASRA